MNPLDVVRRFDFDWAVSLSEVWSDAAWDATTCAALIVEMRYHPPYWVHAVLWAPLILLVTLLPLRLLKGLLIALQYHHKAAEGRLERKGEA